VNARYRLPIVPILLVFAAGGLAGLARARALSPRTLLRPLALFGAALLLVNWNPLGKIDDASQAHFNEGWAEQKSGEMEAAAREYGEVIRESSWYAPALNNRAVILLGRKSWEEAALLLREAVAIDSTYYDAWSNLGRACYAAGRYGEAASAFERAARLWPDDPGFHSNLGLARKGAGDLEGAVRAFRSALAADDRYGRARIHLGEVLIALGRPAEALPELERSARDEPANAAAWHLLGTARAALGREDEARAAWEEVIRLEPSSPLAERARASLRGSP
jgi:tetratricopeptide (TPR) repeat protein